MKLLDSKLSEMVCKHADLEWNAFISKTNFHFLRHSLRLYLEALEMMLYSTQDDSMIPRVP